MLVICWSLKGFNFSVYTKQLLLLCLLNVSVMWTQFPISSCILNGYQIKYEELKIKFQTLPFSITRPVDPPKVLRRPLLAPKEVVASRREPVMCWAKDVLWGVARNSHSVSRTHRFMHGPSLILPQAVSEVGSCLEQCRRDPTVASASSPLLTAL